MYQTRCVCGKTLVLPNVLVCPFCKKNLSDYSEEYSLKHISRCAKSIAPKTYSARGRGRPSAVCEPMEKIPSLCKSCTCCGAVCTKRGSVCAKWTPQEPKGCPICGEIPEKVYSNGILVGLKCPRCNLDMRAYHVRNGDSLLIQCWNNRAV